MNSIMRMLVVLFAAMAVSCVKGRCQANASLTFYPADGSPASNLVLESVPYAGGSAAFNHTFMGQPGDYIWVFGMTAGADTNIGLPVTLTDGATAALSASIDFGGAALQVLSTQAGFNVSAGAGGLGPNPVLDLYSVLPVFPFALGYNAAAQHGAASTSSSSNWNASFSGSSVGTGMSFQAVGVGRSSRASSAAWSAGSGMQLYYGRTVRLTAPTTIHVSGSLSIVRQGATQGFPVLPAPVSGPVATFINAPSGRWMDPPLALGYDFQQAGSSLFTDILSLPVGIDGDGLYEVLVGAQSLGQFAEGSRVDFRQLLGGNGVASFRVTGIDPAADATSVEAFPIQLSFDTPLADFTMTPVTWRKVGTGCSDAVACVTCPTVSLLPVGQAVTGNASFGLSMQNGPTGGVGAFYLGIGHPQANPIPLFCGEVYPQLPVLELGVGFLTGSGACGGAGSIALPLPNDPVFFGLFVTAQSAFLCPAGGIGLTHGIEFPIGS